MKKIALIFAGGTGTRMRKQVPKQFLEIGKKAIIVRTIEVFEKCDDIDEIYVSCIEDWIDYLKELLEKANIKKVVRIVPGGKTGQLSIFNGLKAAYEKNKNENDTIVLIHDGVRPFIDEDLIKKFIEWYNKENKEETVAEEPVAAAEEEVVAEEEAVTEEPFFIASQDSKWVTVSTDISAEHVISISGIVPNIKKIDAKYVDLSGISVLSVMPGGEWTYEKAKEILDSGKLPYIQMSADWFAFILLPCQNNTGFASNDYITFASFISSELADNYNYFSVAYLKLVKGKESADANDVKIYDLSRSEHGDRVILNSSTSGSSKRFKITVDDSGTISATEV